MFVSVIIQLRHNYGNNNSRMNAQKLTILIKLYLNQTYYVAIHCTSADRIAGVEEMMPKKMQELQL